MGGGGLYSWAGCPTTSGSSPLAPGHPAWGGVRAAPAPRVQEGRGPLGSPTAGQEQLHPPAQVPRPTPTLAPWSGSHLCGLHGRPPGPVPSFQRLWVQSKATWSPLSAPGSWWLQPESPRAGRRPSRQVYAKKAGTRPSKGTKLEEPGRRGGLGGHGGVMASATLHRTALSVLYSLHSTE